ncbi:hypothetical protein Tco_0131013 [Tanacetum coccineum]
MAPKRTTRSTPVTPSPITTTTTIIEAQLQALIDQGVVAAMDEAEASKVRNGYDSNGSRPWPTQAVRECSYSEFLKCKPLDFKCTEGVVGLIVCLELKLTSNSKRGLEKVTESSRGTSHEGKTFLLSLLDVSSDSLGIGTISSVLKVLRCSSPIMRESLGSIDGKVDVITKTEET